MYNYMNPDKEGGQKHKGKIGVCITNIFLLVYSYYLCYYCSH